VLKVGARRCSSTSTDDAAHRSRAHRGRDHAAHARDPAGAPAGAPCDLDAIHAIAHVHGLRVVEDASHAIDASWRGKRIGSFGDYASFSFTRARTSPASKAAAW